MDIQKYNYKKEVERKSQFMESSVVEIELERLSKTDGALEMTGDLGLELDIRAIDWSKKLNLKLKCQITFKYRAMASEIDLEVSPRASQEILEL